MDKLPIFPGFTKLLVKRRAEPPSTQTVKFANSGTQSWDAAGLPGWYQAEYEGISDDQLRQVQDFFDAHKSPEQWQYAAAERALKNCYFSAGQSFPEPIKHAKGGHLLTLVFQAPYQKER